MNIWTFTGNLGRDCETRYLPNGDAVGDFSVAVTSGYGDKAVTTWANCALFGKRVDALSPYLKKGQQVCISGEASMRSWTDKQGQERQTLTVRVSSLDLIGGKREEAKPASQSRESFDNFEDDIPF